MNVGSTLPSKLAAGGSLDIMTDGSRFSMVGDISGIVNGNSNSQSGYSPISAGFGLEWAFLRKIELRSGFTVENGFPRVTTGFGVGFDDILVDLSYLISTDRKDPLRGTIRFGMAYCIGASI